MRKAWFYHERGPRMGFKFGPGGPGGFGGEAFVRGWRTGGRARRGDIKYLILEVLAEGQRHGYDIITELENKSNGRYRPSPGSVYPTLTLLEEGGFITGEASDGKRVFTITDAGRRLLAEKPADAQDGEEDEGVDLRGSAMKLGAAVMQAARASDGESQEKVR